MHLAIVERSWRQPESSVPQMDKNRKTLERAGQARQLLENRSFEQIFLDMETWAATLPAEHAGRLRCAGAQHQTVVDLER